MPRGDVTATDPVIETDIVWAAGAAEGSRTERGWVSAVDTEARSTVLEGKNEEVSSAVEARGQVTQQRSIGTFADLMAGERVVGGHTGNGSERVASEVHLLGRD